MQLVPRKPIRPSSKSSRSDLKFHDAIKYQIPTDWQIWFQESWLNLRLFSSPIENQFEQRKSFFWKLFVGSLTHPIDIGCTSKSKTFHLNFNLLLPSLRGSLGSAWSSTVPWMATNNSVIRMKMNSVFRILKRQVLKFSILFILTFLSLPSSSVEKQLC